MFSDPNLAQARAAFNVHCDDVALRKAMDALAVNPNDPDVYGLLFDIFVRRESYQTAREHAQAIIRVLPDHSLGYRCLAWAYLADDKFQWTGGPGRMNLALELAHQALAKGPIDLSNFWIVGQVELRARVRSFTWG